MTLDVLLYSLFASALVCVVPTEAQTTSATPEDPYALRVLNTTSHGILVTWRDPVPVQFYRVSAMPVDGIGRASDGNVAKVRPTNETTHDFDYITPFTNYTLRVEALTTSKAVPAVRTVTAATKQYYPSSVGNVYLQATADTITIQWTEPTRKNGIIIEYYIDVTTDVIVFNTTVDASERSYVIEESIRPYTKYNVSVRAKTEYPQWGPAATDAITTLQTRPSGSPSHLTFTSLTSHSIKLLWGEIDEDERNGKIIGYNLSYIQNGDIQLIQTNQTSLYIDTLFPYTSYIFDVRGYVEIDGNLLYGPNTSVSIITLPKTAVPEISQSLRDQWLIKDGVTQSQIQFILADNVRDVFTLENGAIQFYQILAVAANSSTNIRKTGNGNGLDIPLTWGKAKASDFAKPYAIEPQKVIENSWNTSQSRQNFHNLPNFRQTGEKIVTVGNETCSDDISDYCNGPLLSNTDYCIYLRGWTKTGYFMDSDCVVQTRTKQSLVPIIVAIVVVTIILIIIVPTGVVLYRRRFKTRQSNATRITPRIHTELPSPPNTTDDQEEYETVNEEESSYTIPIADDESRYKNFHSIQPMHSTAYVTDAYVPHAT